METDDAIYVERAQGGDSEAFRVLVRHLMPTAADYGKLVRFRNVPGIYLGEDILEAVAERVEHGALPPGPPSGPVANAECNTDASGSGLRFQA